MTNDGAPMPSPSSAPDAITEIVETMKPKVEGVCDYCGTPLIQRKDDNASSFAVRLENYHKSTAPLLDFYKKAGLLHSFDGTLPILNMEAELGALLKSKE